MSDSLYVVAIAALLPLTACMLVTQVNPYHALIIRGILGAVAALVYALFGAADVALTEALVGTMLSITLYAIAVRSSMSLRLGMLENPSPETQPVLTEKLFPALRTLLKPHHLNLEVLTFSDQQTLRMALESKDIHAVCLPASADNPDSTAAAPYTINVRIRRLYDLLDAALPPTIAAVTFSQALRLTSAEQSPSKLEISNALEGQS